MKTSILKIAASFMFLAIIGCENSNDDDILNGLSTAQITELKGIAASGTWSIAYYFDTDKEETASFNGYTFTFNTDGGLVADNGTNTVNGTWSIVNSDDSSDDSSSDNDDVDFNIAFSTPADFADLTDDWDIVEYSSIRIELIDISGGNGGTDKLVFEKN